MSLEELRGAIQAQAARVRSTGAGKSRMVKVGYSIAGRLIILVLIASFTLRPAIADDRSQHLSRLVPLSSSDAASPIGTVNSFSPIRINGRIAAYQQLIWDGDLLEMLAGMTASVFIKSVGQIALTGETTIRLSTKLADPDDRMAHPVLIASLFKGDISIKLDQQASAYIEARESAFTASEGASFRVTIRDGRAELRV